VARGKLSVIGEKWVVDSCIPSFFPLHLAFHSSRCAIPPPHPLNPKAWILILLLAPLVYVLTTPPVVILFEVMPRRNYVPPAVNWRSEKHPQWTDWYAEPYQWLQHRSPLSAYLKDPLGAYEKWWFKRLIQ
jgi:hypothetical protein